jgi:hypothetical protein
VPRVTTITLPERLHDVVRTVGAKTGRSMAAVVRDALERDLGGAAAQARRGRARPTRRAFAPPPSVMTWLRAPAGSYRHLAPDAEAAPTDWDPDAQGSGLDAD